MTTGQSKFAFLDEGEAMRRLGVEHDTLLTYVREKRLRAFPGVGKGNFFRVSDLDRLYAELHPEAASQERVPAATPEAISARKQHDPAYRVHLRLQADLKWFDITDGDLAAWVRELHPDGYARQRANITRWLAKLEHLRDLMDAAATHWQNLPPGEASPGEEGTEAD